MKMHNAATRALQIAQACEVYANAKGHQGVFLTLTLPSRYHAKRLEAGVMVGNPDHQHHLTPRKGHEELKRCWNAVRESMRRMGREAYGLRVVEPHADGTPHWHVMLWVENDVQRHAIKRLAAHNFGAGCISVSTTGAKRPFRAASYFGKYLSKADERQAKWAMCWGIKRFAAVGMVAVGELQKGGVE
ncbi:hypothetical protein DZC30_05100 [Comamonas testosteroni]|uniref:Replication gene A protein-like domain-containing protein n=1 Tax=Comamonas testosteroni TaxID=285 RepID=A0A373FQJ8_COMTE|nr:replication endonuclease [Comamonas testosteroni]RGE46147.1 hypothetical protein DZC30_05100 [Comamonas testosteroni]